MKVNKDDFIKKLNYLGMSISKDMTTKAYTRLIRFCNTGKVVYAYTFDGLNNIKVKIGDLDKESVFYVVVDYALLNNFVKTCEGDITLESKNKFLHIKSSNVKCKLPIFNGTDSSNEFNIPNPENPNYPYDNDLTESIDLGIIKTIIDPKHIVEAYRNVYFGQSILATDADNIVKIDKKVFTNNLILSINSIDILSKLSNVKYSCSTEDKVKYLCVKSDELIAKLTLMSDENHDFDYNEFMTLYNYEKAETITLDTSVLSKAVNTSLLFKVTPNLVFNNKGVFLQIDSVDFIYKLSDTPCEDRIIKFPFNISKMICALGESITLYYKYILKQNDQEVDNTIRCDGDNCSEIISIEEVSINGQ